MEKEIRVVIIEPGKPSYRKTIPNTLKAFQEIVGGYIEVVPLPGNTIMVVNEDGKIIGAQINRAATHILKLSRKTTDFIVGTAIITGIHEDVFVGLDDATAALYEDLE